MKISVKVDGIKLERTVNALPANMTGAVVTAVADVCNTIAETAKEKCPTDSGDLRALIATAVSADGTRVVGTIGTGVEYAPFVHQGTGIYAAGGNGRQTPWVYKTGNGKFVTTRGQRPQPFLRDAVEQHRDSVNARLGEVIRKCLNQS